MPNSAPSTATAAIDTAISAGWAFSVSISRLSGPSHMMVDSLMPSASSISSKTARAAVKCSARAWPMPACWLPWPGKVKATDNRD